MASKQASIGRIENVPLTEQARTAILEAILDKRFDERLPSEEALAEMLNVSRTTIRTALQSLEQEGIITRKRAIGTTINAHVRPSTLSLQRMVGFDGLLREKGYSVDVEVIWSRGTPGEDFVESFSLEPDQDSLLSEKSYFADGKLAIFVRDAMLWANLKDQKFDGEVEASIFEFSSAAWTVPVDHVVAEILPVVKRSKETTKVPVERGEAITRLLEYHYDSRGDQLAVSMVDVDTDFIHFEVFRRR
ncbi:MAG: GntR family transcriptional regulator [Solirubrobacterales bacterium]|nr:GntR family transcriptional regulator [Solirubrobacterales bacterium]